MQKKNLKIRTVAVRALMLSPDHIARQLAPRHRAAFHSGQSTPVIREDQQRIGKAIQQSPSRIIATSIAHLSLLGDPPVRYDKPTLLQQPNSLDPYFSPTTLLRVTSFNIFLSELCVRERGESERASSEHRHHLRSLWHSQNDCEPPV
jgi:hypothetical protein